MTVKGPIPQIIIIIIIIIIVITIIMIMIISNNNRIKLVLSDLLGLIHLCEVLSH